MDDTPTKRGGVTAAQFFALRLDGVTLTAAQLATGLAYTTICRVRDRGESCDPDSVRRVAAWSREVPAAVDAGVWIDASATLGLVEHSTEGGA